jgi:hypothetical protein
MYCGFHILFVLKVQKVPFQSNKKFSPNRSTEVSKNPELCALLIYEGIFQKKCTKNLDPKTVVTSDFGFYWKKVVRVLSSFCAFILLNFPSDLKSV